MPNIVSHRFDLWREREPPLKKLVGHLPQLNTFCLLTYQCCISTTPNITRDQISQIKTQNFTEFPRFVLFPLPFTITDRILLIITKWALILSEITFKRSRCSKFQCSRDPTYTFKSALLLNKNFIPSCLLIT